MIPDSGSMVSHRRLGATVYRSTLPKVTSAVLGMLLGDSGLGFVGGIELARDFAFVEILDPGVYVRLRYGVHCTLLHRGSIYFFCSPTISIDA